MEILREIVAECKETHEAMMSSATFSSDELNKEDSWVQKLDQEMTECESVFLDYVESRKGDPSSRSQSSWTSTKSAATRRAEAERECKEAAIRRGEEGH